MTERLRRLAAPWYVQWPVIICLLCNPYLFGRGLYRLNPELANEFVMPVLLLVQPVLMPLAIASGLACAAIFQIECDWRLELWVEKRPRWALALGLGAVAFSAVGWFAIAVGLLAGSLGFTAATPAYSRRAQWAQSVLIVALWGVAIEFLFSMSLEPFTAVAKIDR